MELGKGTRDTRDAHGCRRRSTTLTDSEHSASARPTRLCRNTDRDPLAHFQSEPRNDTSGGSFFLFSGGNPASIKLSNHGRQLFCFCWARPLADRRFCRRYRPEARKGSHRMRIGPTRRPLARKGKTTYILLGSSFKGWVWPENPPEEDGV